HAEARHFGTRAELLGAPLRAIEGDITDLWQNELLKSWKARPAAIAGLTERPALFLLERLAWEHGLPVVFEAEHEPSGRGGPAHRIVRAADPRIGDDLERAGAGWPSVLADALVAGNRAPARAFGPTDSGLAAMLDEPAKLYSWIIAPRAAALGE